MIEQLKQRLSGCFDVIFNEVEINNQIITMVFLSSLTSQDAVNQLVEGFLFSEHQRPSIIFNGSKTVLKDVEAAIVCVLSGQTAVFIDDVVYAIETRHYPSASVTDPKNEKSIRGSADSFNENILVNVGLIRRRIRNQNLKVSIEREGPLTKTDLAILYMQDSVKQQDLDDFYQRYHQNQTIEINNERNLIEALYGKTLNPYPHVRYSERPDICAIHLLQGYLVILVDNMPSSIILPTTFFEQLQQMEEFTQTPLISILTRLIRYLGVFVSLYVLPFVIALVLSHKSIFNFEIDPFTFAMQVLFAELIVEWIRQALIYSPSVLSSIMGFIVVFVLGDFGIEIGVYTKDVLIFVALCNLTNFLTPSYEVALANKFCRIIMSLVTLMFGMNGFVVSVIVHVHLLMSTKTIHHPYLYPFIPFNAKELKRLLFNTSIYLKHSSRKV